MTLPSSFIALRQEAITTMIFTFFFPLSFSLFILLYFYQQNTNKNQKIVIPGPANGFWPHAFSSWSHTPSPISIKTFFIFSISLSLSLSLSLSFSLYLPLIAHRREAVTTMIFSSFFPFSLFLFRFSFCSIYIQQILTKIKK